jgi:hypothetical protein
VEDDYNAHPKQENIEIIEDKVIPAGLENRD